MHSKHANIRTVQRDTSVREHMNILQKYVDMDDVTEICVNRPFEVWIEARGEWTKFDEPELSFEKLRMLGVAVAKFTHDEFSETKPVLSAVLPDGERSQFVLAPACEEGTISLTIRKPSFSVRTLDDYSSQGFFDKIKPIAGGLEPHEQKLLDLKLQSQSATGAQARELQVKFLKLAVKYNKNIVIAGATGSGKTTFMKALMQEIPTIQRIVTIEDVPELFLPNHPNHVHLFYPSEAKADAIITASSCLRSCLRMKPDRILLAELRGGETFDFVNACLSGHGGSITSCHSGSCADAFEYLTLKVLQNPQGKELGYEVAKKLLSLVLDVVIHIHNDHDDGRHITEIWYDPWLKRGGNDGQK